MLVHVAARWQRCRQRSVVRDDRLSSVNRRETNVSVRPFTVIICVFRGSVSAVGRASGGLAKKHDDGWLPDRYWAARVFGDG